MPSVAEFTTTNYKNTRLPYELTGDIEEVPHIGPASRKALAHVGIYSSFQMLGHFLKHKRDERALAAFLKENGVSMGNHAEEAANAISERVATVGVKLRIVVPTEVDGKPVSSKLTDEQGQAIQACEFNNDLRHDLPGIGFGRATDAKLNASVQELERNGIDCTDALFGEMLECFPGRPTSTHVENFYKVLGDKGCAHGYKCTVIDAMKLKLDVGLDHFAARRHQEPIPEEPEPPGTGQQRRYQSRVTHEEPAPKPQPGPSFGLKTALAVAFMGVAYYWLFAGSASKALEATES